jgi:hypothetical protein
MSFRSGMASSCCCRAFSSFTCRAWRGVSVVHKLQHFHTTPRARGTRLRCRPAYLVYKCHDVGEIVLALRRHARLGEKLRERVA